MQLEFKGKKIEYCIFDPTGNITALVETAVDPEDQPAVSSRIMELEPDVEQVGFVSFRDEPLPEDGAAVSLRMAGGEFCGNATMCAAALYMVRAALQGEATVMVRVSGASEPLEVRLARTGGKTFAASVAVPPALGIDFLTLEMSWKGFSGSVCLPVVTLEGITHLIVRPGSEVFDTLKDRETAEAILKLWYPFLEPDCLGMMFLGDGDEIRKLTPLVYVPGVDTMFWENSCASGSAAAGMFLASQSRGPVDVTFDEPAGRLRVESAFPSYRTTLHGSVKLVKECL